jgi:hypothetical protein
LIQIPRATTSLAASPSTSSITTASSTVGNKGLQTKFAYAIYSEYGHYTHHFPSLPQFFHTLVVVFQTFQEEPSLPPISGTHVTNIRYVSSSVPRQMRCPCALCDSLSYFTYQSPLITRYWDSHLTPVQPLLITLPLVLHSRDIVNVTSPKPKSLFTLHGSYIDYLRIFPQILPILWFISHKKYFPLSQFITHNV